MFGFQALDEAVSTRNARILELKQHLSEQQVELEQLRSINAQQAQTIKASVSIIVLIIEILIC
jgi:hypothetical protein